MARVSPSFQLLYNGSVRHSRPLPVLGALTEACEQDVGTIRNTNQPGSPSRSMPSFFVVSKGKRWTC
jgi:hypothetical protein